MLYERLPQAGDGSGKLSPVFARKAPTSHHKIATIIQYIFNNVAKQYLLWDDDCEDDDEDFDVVPDDD